MNVRPAVTNIDHTASIMTTTGARTTPDLVAEALS
jgi:hypothetical protein